MFQSLCEFWHLSLDAKREYLVLQEFLEEKHGMVGDKTKQFITDGDVKGDDCITPYRIISYYNRPLLS